VFPEVFGRPVVAQFDEREGSSDGGALLLKAADRHYGLVAGLPVWSNNSNGLKKHDLWIPRGVNLL